MKILTLRINNGGEYKSNDFLNCYRHNGIKREFTNSYSTHQNGVKERKNMTIVKMARSMFKTKSLGIEFQVEAVYTLN